MHGVGLAFHRSLMKNMAEEPTFCTERLFSLQIRLVRNKHVHIIAAYAPTLDSDEGSETRFYSELVGSLRGINPRKKFCSLGTLTPEKERRKIYGAKRLVLME